MLHKSVRFILLLVWLVLISSQTLEQAQVLEDLVTDILDEETVELLKSEEFKEAPEYHKPVKETKQGSIFQSSDCPLPPNFPYGIPSILGNFQNWSEDLQVSNLWTTFPRSSKDVVTLANWAYIYGYKIRAKGYSKSWAPLTVTKNAGCANTILVDTTRFLNQMKIISSKSDTNLRAVHAQAGTSMEKLMQFMTENHAALYAIPAIGETTIGGVLAVGGHGTGVPRRGTRMAVGHSSGSLSNLVLSFKAVVWDYDLQSYGLKKFTRSDEDSKAFLTHIGRAFITDVRLLVGPEYNVRCECHFDYNAEQLLGKPTRIDTDKESVAGLVERYNSVDLMIYPYTESIFATVCSNSTRNQGGSRYVEKPFPFQFDFDPAPKAVSLMASKFLAGMTYLSPVISKVEFQLDKMKVKFNKNENIWGPSNNLLLKYKNAFKRTVSSGYAILTTRVKVQKIANDFYSFYNGLIAKFAVGWKFPQNEPLTMSITGLDSPTDISGVGEFEPPALSFLSPVKGKDYDTAIIISVNALPGTRHFETFMREMESYLFLKYDGADAIVRPEWSKAWAYTDMAAWENQIMLKKVIPSSFGENWNWALQRFDYYDPYMIFSNDFLDSFLKSNGTLKPKINSNKNKVE